uniref:V-type proton ATPase subunit G n=1 Tax=Panagrellus redivivus TaxID=6233 RepID=A0A7E4W963_PANRE
MSQDRSIHQLITAERKAIEKVNEAKKRRQIRLKAAKEEAAAQIAVLRQELENKLSRFEREHLGNKDDVQAAIDAEIEKELRDIHESVEANKSAVVQRLLDLVCDIRPDMHHNLTLQKKIGADEAAS